MSRPIKVAAAVLTLIGATAGSKVVAQPGLEPARQAGIDGLVVRLGDPDFPTREAAERDLLSLGLAAKPAVLKALQQSTDPEIRARCQRLVPQINFNFCWARASRIFGNTAAARLQFVELYGPERELWYALAEGDPGLGRKYAARCKELATGPPRSGARNEAADLARYELREGRLGTLLVIGAECRSQIPEDALLLAAALFKRQWGGQYAKDTPPLLRRSYLTWAEEVSPLPVEYTGDKKLERPRAALRSGTVPARDRPDALLTLARAQDKGDDDLIRGFLTDDTVCDTLFSKGIKTEVRLRDIALAAR